MFSCINVPPSDRQNASVDNIDESPHKVDENQNNCGDEEEDEDEDVDFNPFLKGTPSPEASSSLSSEVHCLDGNSSKPTTGEEQNYAVGDSEHGEEVVMPTAFTSDTEKQLLQRPVHRKFKKRKSDSISVPENQSVPHQENNSFIKPAMSLDDEDAIWKRTRARYSLASFTLDELETFLQETDDEDDLQNVDDEQEYRKFLAAVLQGGDGDGHSTQDNDNVDDEDEDNDADFEIELEELLESDVDDSKRDKDRKVEYERGVRRPETRQNRRQKASAQYKKKLLEQTKRPLRPLLPILPNGSIASFPTADGKTLTPETAPSYLSSAAEEGLINGFTPQQIGQLHCLIHEHVQLLIQVFSLSILDPSRQQVASQVQGLIFEMLHKRDEVIACRGVSYPCICFRSPNMCPSVTDEIPDFNPAQCTESSSTPNMQILVSENISTTRERNGQISSSQTAGSFWVPFMSGPIISILDVAPLNLVGRYIDDVFNAVREYRQRHLDSSCDTWNEREPLFHLPNFPSLTEANGEVSKGNMPPAFSTVPTTPGQNPPKKTLAASIVENAKKQSVALVPKDISALAQRFFTLFNPALFPHKPPPAAVANRVLFTDSEDELLALGMTEYNTDWKAIQQRFLPCKTKHQIFVRQKNRCSSKAPENPIKAVRRLKTSPLNAEEIECIQEGLRVFKHDWMSVWRFIVPHRDPSLLPRQWRIALGTQKSYKSDAAKKEKRRIYESNRRRCKTADLANWQQVSDQEDNQVDSTGGENNSGDDYVDNVNEAYVHQAFLADWRPDASCLTSSENPSLNLGEKNLPTGALLREDIHVREQSQIDNIHRFPYARHYQYPHAVSHFTHARYYPSNSMQLKHQVSDTTLNATKSQIYMWPYRTRRTDGAHLVKLAPDLPPVNLPPTVRVISQAAFKSNQFRAPVKVPASGGNSGAGRERENFVPQLPHVANLRATSLAKAKKDESNQVPENVTNTCPEDLTTSRPEESAVLHDTGAAEQRGNDSDLQMHPLLFQAPEDGCLSYYPPNCSTSTSSSFAFFSANQPQLNLSLFHSPNQANQVADCFNKSSKTKEPTSTSFGIDFHPLLQITDEENSDFAAACSSTHQFVCLGGKSAQFQNPLNAVRTKSPVNSGPSATSPKPSGCNEKANELDLEIHLSSTSTKEKTKGNRDVGSNNQRKSTISAPNSGNTIEKHKPNSPCPQHSENCSTVQSKLVSSADALAVPSNSDRRCNMDDLGDQSHPEIVMEQEELSDSEEETEEHVEFEREEMADSDGEEGLDSEPIAEVQNKESPSFVTEKVAADADCLDKQCEWKSIVPQCNTSIPGKGSPILKLSLTSMGKDGNGSSWLTLDSCAPIDPPSMNAKYEECRIGVYPVTKNLASGRPNRSCKKTTPSRKSIVTEKDAMDMAQQLSLGPLAVSTLKKPRKRACRTNTGLSTGMTTANSRCDQDKFG